MEEIVAVRQSALEKIFPDQTRFAPDFGHMSAFWGEEAAWQVALRRKGGWGPGDYVFRVTSPLGDAVEVFRVENVPCELPAYPEESGHDSDYITLTPGLFPDVLRPLRGEGLTLSSHGNTVLWINVRVPEGLPEGEYPVTLTVEGQGARCESTFSLQVIGCALPPQKLLFTQWFHLDCLAQYYGVPVYSEEHWEITERFLRCAAAHGMNTVLTPVITPPLDTEVGGERLCTQLVGVERAGGEYAFDFSRLRRFIAMAESAGVTHFEVCQLFSQWGAKCAPNIYVRENGELRRAFGWETDGDDPEYLRFLRELLTRTAEVFRELGLSKRVLFHISDEPGKDHLETYARRRAFLKEVLGDLPVMDAISDRAFCERGLIDMPVVSTDHIEPFIRAETKDLWAYYCCGQNRAVGNRFLAMPSYRNRVLGLQLYKYRIRGFLQWGYNFWNSWHSRYPIDPYRVTDGAGAFPGGDAFSVYPGPGGEPVCSLRLKVFLHGLQDLRALRLLESLVGRAQTEALIPEYDALRFDAYPRDAGYYLDLREKLNRKVAWALRHARMQKTMDP